MCVWIPLLLAAAPHSVAVDLSALDRKSYQELDAVSLERALVVRLVQEGFAVVASNASPEVRLKLTREGRAAELSAGDEKVSIELDLKHLREFHLEVAQKAVQLARSAAKALDEKKATEPPPAPPPAPEPPHENPKPPAEWHDVPPPPEPFNSWNVLAGAGVLFRAPGLDPRISLAARYALSRRIGLHLEAGLSPIPGAAISVYDTSLLLGAGLALINLPLVRVELGLSLGIALHTFSVADPSAVDRFDSRVDFLGRPFLRAVLNPIGGLLIWLQAGAGVSSRAREHRLLSQVLYSRGALWVDAQVGLGWEL
jgi:hypothetical protein